MTTETIRGISERKKCSVRAVHVGVLPGAYKTLPTYVQLRTRDRKPRMLDNSSESRSESGPS